MFINKQDKISIQVAAIIAIIILSQQLLPWSFMYKGVISGQANIASSADSYWYLTINILLFSYVRILIPKLKLQLGHSAFAGSDQAGEEGQGKIESLIAYASQSGTAAAVAKNMAKQLPQTSRYHLACVSSLRAHHLNDYQQVFLLASTYGDGEPPEQAMSFVSSLQKLEQPLAKVKYAVLALGDKQYPKFCAFGHQLAATLQQKGAQALLPVMEINQGHEGSIQLWWQQLTQLLGWHSSTLEKTWHKQQVIINECLNPQALERPAHHLSLTAMDCDFSPGDLVEVMPEADEVSLLKKINVNSWLPETRVTLDHKSVSLVSALKQLYWQDESADNAQALIDKLPKLTARTYSIASCQEQGVLDLLVRKLVKADNSVGLCSGYLTQLSARQTVKLSIKTHHQFHPPSVQTPVIMIAAGTGLAPFIGFLEQRNRAEQYGKKYGKSWLIMGERSEVDDNYFNESLNKFQRSGCLHKRQHAWSKSKSSSQPNYVAEIIAAEQNDIRHWLLDLNAQLYICGNAATLGVSCDEVLTDILGKKVLSELKKHQQIKYDLY